MGSGALVPIVQAEAAKPIDASDLAPDDAAAAIEEVKRLRALLKQEQKVAATTPTSARSQVSDKGYINGQGLPVELEKALAKHTPSSNEATVLNNIVTWGQERLEQMKKQAESEKKPAKTRQSLFVYSTETISQVQNEVLERNTVAKRQVTADVLNEKAKEDAARSAFALFDSNGDGTIDVTELDKAFSALKINATQAELLDMLNEVDSNQNGKIDFAEFLSLMGKANNRIKTAAVLALVAQHARKSTMLFDVNPTEEAMELAKCEKCAISAKVSATPDEKGVDIEDLAISDDGFRFQPVFEHAVAVEVPYEIQTDLQSGLEVETLGGKKDGQKVLHVEPWVLRQIAERAITHVEHYLRPGHLEQLSSILKDDEASDNDRFVAESLLRNAVIAAKGVLPGCQDTGTAICLGKKGQFCFADDDEKHFSHGIYDAYTKRNLRYSQVSPVSMFAEKNTACNLPAQFDIYSVAGNEYKLMFMAKGGGSANKTYLFQQTKAVLNPKSLEAFIKEKVITLGTSACPPYHLAIVIGGLSAEMNLKTVKLASARYLDDLPQEGNALGRAYRDITWEKKILALCQGFGIGAQFGGKYFVHDVRVVRLPRHGASCPVGIGVSCSADRQILCKITPDGVFLEQLEKNPARFLPPDIPRGPSDKVVDINLDQPMMSILTTLSQHPIKTRLNLSGTIIVARDIAHAKLAERLEKDGMLPDYMSAHAVYYAGPAKTPEGYASGSFGPTTAGRMDSYVPLFMKNGASLLTLAKGNRSKAVTDACKEHKGFYLGSIGGAAANLAEHVIKKVELVEYEELGMEAVWCIKVVDFPAFIIVDDKGNDFFSSWKM